MRTFYLILCAACFGGSIGNFIKSEGEMGWLSASFGWGMVLFLISKYYKDEK